MLLLRHFIIITTAVAFVACYERSVLVDNYLPMNEVIFNRDLTSEAFLKTLERQLR